MLCLMQRPCNIPAHSLPVAPAGPVLLCRGSSGGAEAHQTPGRWDHQGSLEVPWPPLPLATLALLSEGQISFIQVCVCVCPRSSTAREATGRRKLSRMWPAERMILRTTNLPPVRFRHCRAAFPRFSNGIWSLFVPRVCWVHGRIQFWVVVFYHIKVIKDRHITVWTYSKGNMRKWQCKCTMPRARKCRVSELDMLTLAVYVVIRTGKCCRVAFPRVALRHWIPKRLFV